MVSYTIKTLPCSPWNWVIVTQLLVTRVHSPSTNASVPTHPWWEQSPTLAQKDKLLPLLRLPTSSTNLLHSPCMYITHSQRPVHSYPLNKLLHIALDQEPDKIAIILMEGGIAVESPKPSSEEETWVKTCESDFVRKSNYWEFQLHQDQKIGC